MTAAIARRPVALTKAVLAILGTVAFMAGIPWALIHFVGNPLPTVIPSIEDIRFAITHGQIDQWTIIKGIAIVAWLAWAHLAASFAVEVAAAIRGGTAAAVRGLGATQWFAAKVVSQFSLAATLMFQSTIGIAAAGAIIPPLPSAMAAPAVEVDAGSLYVEDNALQSQTEVEGSTVEVGRRDTLWGLAEQHLGDGQRWEEIRDANVGRTMADGTKLGTGFTSLEQGWNLTVPGLTDTTIEAETGAVETSLADSETLETGQDSEIGEWIIGSWQVEPGDHFWKISEEILQEAWGREPTNMEVTAYWIDVVGANRQHLISPGGDANLIYPHQRFEVLLPPVPADINSPGDAANTTTPYAIDGLDQFTPATPGPTEVSEAATMPEPVIETMPAADVEPVVEAVRAPTPPVPPVAETTSQPTLAPRPEPEPTATTASTSLSETSSVDVRTIGLGIFGTAVGAGALMMLLRRRRHLQAARRRPNTVIEETPIMPSEFEHRIRPIGDTDAVRWLQATNQFLTHRLAQHPENPLPAVVAMRAGRFGIEILLDEPCIPVDGFINGGADGKAWRLHPDLDQRMIEAEAIHAHAYSPALLPVGTTEAGDLLLDFEQIGSLSLEGDDHTIEGWLRSIAVGVTSVPWSQHCEVIAIGLGDEIGNIEQVTVPDDPTAWAQQAVTIHTATARRLTASPYEQRVHPGELQHPQLVLIGPGHAGIAQHLAETADLAYSSLAVIAAAPLTNETRIDIQPTLATIEPLGIDFEPATTELDAIKLAVQALQAASNNITTPSPDYFDQPHPGPAPASTHEPAEEPPDREIVENESRISVFDDATEFGYVEGPDGTGNKPEHMNQPLSDSQAAEPSNDVVLNGSAPDTTAEPTPSHAQPGDPNVGEPEQPSHKTEIDLTANADEVSEVAGEMLPDETASAIDAITARQPIEVSLLRPAPRIEGIADQPRAKIAAVIAYVAFCRSLPAERIRTIFWPNSVSRGTSDNAIAETRRILGHNNHGDSRLPLATNTGRFELDPEVGCDWHRFEQLAAIAKNASTPRNEAACLEAALTLIEGRPGSEAPGKLYEWFTDDHEIYIKVETAIVDAAYRLGELAIETENAALAKWAAGQGLTAVPGQEALHRIQMKAAALAGDKQGIEDAYRAAMRSAETLSAWEDVQPETDELYATLTRRNGSSKNVQIGERSQS